VIGIARDRVPELHVRAGAHPHRPLVEQPGAHREVGGAAREFVRALQHFARFQRCVILRADPPFAQRIERRRDHGSAQLALEMRAAIAGRAADQLVLDQERARRPGAMRAVRRVELAEQVRDRLARRQSVEARRELLRRDVGNRRYRRRSQLGRALPVADARPEQRPIGPRRHAVIAHDLVPQALHRPLLAARAESRRQIVAGQCGLADQILHPADRRGGIGPEDLHRGDIAAHPVDMVQHRVERVARAVERVDLFPPPGLEVEHARFLPAVRERGAADDRSRFLARGALRHLAVVDLAQHVLEAEIRHRLPRVAVEHLRAVEPREHVAAPLLEPGEPDFDAVPLVRQRPAVELGNRAAGGVEQPAQILGAARPCLRHFPGVRAAVEAVERVDHVVEVGHRPRISPIRFARCFHRIEIHHAMRAVAHVASTDIRRCRYGEC
jgi:hypothetical protein